MPGAHSLSTGSPALRIALGPGQPLLCRDQPLFSRSIPAWIVHRSSVTKGRVADDADIDTGVLSGRGQGIRWYIVTRENHYPAVACPLYLNRLDTASNFAVEMNSHVPNALQIYPLCVGQPSCAVAVLWPLHAGEPGIALEPWISRFPPGLDSAEETVERLVESAQGGLLTRERPDGHIGTYRPDVLQLRRLVAVLDRGLTLFPCVPTLLQCRVVKLAVRLHAGLKRDVLTRGRAQAEYKRAPHDATTLSAGGQNASAE